MLTSRLGRIVSGYGRLSSSYKRRNFHSSKINNGGHGHYNKEYEFVEPHISRTHQFVGEAMLTLTWLWIFYRAKKDLVYVLGLKHPWDDHHGDHHDEEDDHDHHH